VQGQSTPLLIGSDGIESGVFTWPLDSIKEDWSKSSYRLGNNPESHLVSKANALAFGAGHLDLAVVEDMPSRRLVSSLSDVSYKGVAD